MHKDFVRNATSPAPSDQWLTDYFERYKGAFDGRVFNKLHKFYEIASKVQEKGNKLIFAGNGASAAIPKEAPRSAGG